ncbi:MAG TPA: redoxin domain-containing protein [Thermoanaerobaculia bacterium]|nr:redoxin domain-containing protein [Thermoanaerobaculia bacterium]
MPAITVPLRAPELVEGTWIQGPRVSLAFSRGAVVLVDFWESTCINCLRTLPYLKEWHRRYGSRGLVIVGIHTPEFELTATPEVVAQAVQAEGIPYSVLLDVGKANWQRFANHFWPAKYLIDARGYMRYEHFGEGAYGETEECIQRLLREAGDLGELPEPLAPLREEDRPGAVCHPMTPEVYVGYHRGRLAAPLEGYRPGEEVRHPGEECIPEGMFTARGLWFHEAEYLEAREPGAELELVYRAASVGVVLEPAGEVEIKLDGEAVPEALRGADVVAENGRTLARWERPRLVQLIGAGKFGEHRLRLRFLSPGARVYAFSFTSCVADTAAAGASKN